MFSSIVAFILFVGAHSSFSNYPSLNGINHHTRSENSLDDMELSSRKTQQSNEVVNCDIEAIFNAVRLNELQLLIEAVAERTHISPFAVLRMLQKRINSNEEIEENIINVIEEASLEDLFNHPLKDIPPPIELSPVSNEVPYALPPNFHLNTDTEDEKKLIIVPVTSSMSNSVLHRMPLPMKTEVKSRNEEPTILNNIVPSGGKSRNTLSAVFPMLSAIKSNHLKPPLGATVRVNSGDPRHAIDRDITVTVSPLMTLIEALREAEIKYQTALGLSLDSDVIKFAHSSRTDCYMVNSIDDVVRSDASGWKVKIVDRNGQVVYDNFCIPSGKDAFVKPGTVISLSYVPL
ncbi:uncharacterized protein LOC118181700 isoform X1 [Stegodyphus dumicola]|uniref:uncharacterized protein LOC118181700 isoform X1 n=1 Tax=Stegodyphus dumicola TaxID=202533 RepID=UPI0015AA0DFD|nr:uncharacterized protein LOC118181700 isoform X1 [Stegodyphus dumicola]XP_035206781.1 uncharacterized protein LOC118181700 isoform X1 [Stegodyphus dumicola]XP_035206782.1 uncharacterized protein LOC118181700 isoform X1 [Stegodyphus dumicola]